MMKTVGIVTIVISVFLFGSLRFFKLKTRPDGIELFIKLLSIYNQELEWSHKSISEIIYDFEFYKFEEYLNLTRELLENYNFESAFIERNEMFRTLYLSDDDKMILKYFFSETGKSGLAAEHSLCDKTLAALEQKKKEATETYKKLGPLTLKLSLICGVWLGIMLI